MNIPDLPYFDPIVDKTGMLTPKWQQALQQLLTELQNNLSQEGIQMPQQPTAKVDLLNVASSTARILYDSTQNLFFANIAGTFKQILTT